MKRRSIIQRILIKSIYLSCILSLFVFLAWHVIHEVLPCSHKTENTQSNKKGKNIEANANTKPKELMIAKELGLGLWCLTPLSTIFQLYIVMVSFTGGRTTGVPWENHRPAVSHRHTLSHNVVSSRPHNERNRNINRW